MRRELGFGSRPRARMLSMANVAFSARVRFMLVPPATGSDTCRAGEVRTDFRIKPPFYGPTPPLPHHPRDRADRAAVFPSRCRLQRRGYRPAITAKLSVRDIQVLHFLTS
jgi:hypothetical protein